MNVQQVARNVLMAASRSHLYQVRREVEEAFAEDAFSLEWAEAILTAHQNLTVTIAGACGAERARSEGPPTPSPGVGPSPEEGPGSLDADKTGGKESA